MAVDVKQLFDQDLPAALSKNEADAKSIGAKYQINVTGAGAWFVDVSDSGPSIKAGEHAGADCTITISQDDFQKLHENPQANGMALYMQQKLKIVGNPMLAMKLQKLFALKG
ncbi:MAG: SCP2 sterol-binding domain-containing protein [Polyangiaceae bacterium]|jgi:putative sterol carrier protein|nr:SCP2 sterol-binding domain-containing protein [Polyangiaceae bacterium]